MAGQGMGVANIVQDEADAMAMEAANAALAETEADANNANVSQQEVSSQPVEEQMSNPQMGQENEQPQGDPNALEKTANTMDHYGMFAMQSGLIGAVLGKVTGHKVVGTAIAVAGTKLLQEMELLPKSFSEVGEYINRMKSYFNGEHQQEQAEKQVFQDQVTKDGKEIASLGDSFHEMRNVSKEMGADGVTSLQEQMRVAGAQMGQTDVFVAVGQMSDAQLQPLQMSSQGNMQVLETTVRNLAKDGALSDAQKTDVVAEFKNIYDGFQAYSEGAKEAYGASHEGDTVVFDQGLQRVMSQEMGPFYETMQSLQKEYQLFSEEDLAHFKGTDVLPGYANTGVETPTVEPSQAQTEVSQDVQVSKEQSSVHTKKDRPLPTIRGGSGMSMDMEYQ